MVLAALIALALPLAAGAIGLDIEAKVAGGLGLWIDQPTPQKRDLRGLLSKVG